VTAPAAKPRILLVDDDPRILSGLRRQLHRDFQVVTAESGAHALTALAAEKDFAVVVSDMRMPGMDGAALLARIRVESPNTTRILLTGQTELNAAVRAINDGQIFRFLSKPCPPDVLEKCLQEAVARNRAALDEQRLPSGSVSDRRVMALNERDEVVGAGTRPGSEHRWFHLQYQPIVTLGGTRVVGVEAILRWLDTEGELIEPPSAPAADEAPGLHMPLGRWMITAACQEVASWPALGQETLRVHVKLFARQLHDPGLVENLAQSLILSGLEPHRVWLEVPRALPPDDAASAARLSTIAQWGVRLVLLADDTGPEPAVPLSYAAVKVSVRHAGDEPARNMIDTAVALGRRLTVPIIATDVDCEQCDTLARRSGCDLAQGAFHGPPADPGDLLPGLVSGRRGGIT